MDSDYSMGKVLERLDVLGNSPRSIPEVLRSDVSRVRQDVGEVIYVVITSVPIYMALEYIGSCSFRRSKLGIFVHVYMPVSPQVGTVEPSSVKTRFFRVLLV
jgi:hypothetical protein